MRLYFPNGVASDHTLSFTESIFVMHHSALPVFDPACEFFVRLRETDSHTS